MPIEINHSRCIQCIGCASVCPVGAIELDGLRMVFHPEKCISCGACVKACPANAIKFIKKEAHAEHKEHHQGEHHKKE